jgi:hypothetical protein
MLQLEASAPLYEDQEQWSFRILCFVLVFIPAAFYGSDMIACFLRMPSKAEFTGEYDMH